MDMTKDDKAAILFALSILRQNIRVHAKEMDRSGFFADAALPTIGSLDALRRKVAADPDIPSDFKARKIELCVKDDDLACEGTIEELLDSGGGMIDSCMEPPAALFKIEGDNRWWAASVELHVGLANPEWAAETVRSELDAVEDDIADAAEGEVPENLRERCERLKLELLDLPPEREEEDDDA